MTRRDDILEEPGLEGQPALDWVAGEIGPLRRAYERLRGQRLRPGERWWRVGGGRALRVLRQPPFRSRSDGVALLYFHGGGWFLGSPVTHAAIGRSLAAATGLTVHAPDYRLVPGHSGAAALRDGLAALRRLLRAPGIEGVVLAGDSAGAAVALAVAAAATGRHRGRLCGVLAFYGAYGLEDSCSIRAFGRRAEGLDPASVAALYARLRQLSGEHPYRVAQLSRRLPPVHLWVGDGDPLLDDSLALHAALRGSKRLTRVADAGHSYLHDTAGEAARQTLREAAAAVARWVR